MKVKSKCAVVLLLLASVAYAKDRSDLCKIIEYAELKDMDTKDLQQIHCEYFDMFGLLIKQQLTFDPLNGDFDAYNDQNRQSMQCLSESNRIQAILKKRSPKAVIDDCKKFREQNNHAKSNP